MNKRSKMLKKKYHSDPKFRESSLKNARKYARSPAGREKNKTRCRLFNRKNYGVNIEFTLSVLTHARIYSAFRAQKTERLYSTEKLLGCNWKEYKKYLQKRFKKNMKWKQEPSFKWHIDHIRPVSSFDLTKASQQKKAFNYKNTQPLFIGEHIKKTSKYMSKLEYKVVRLSRQNKEYRKALKEVIK